MFKTEFIIFSIGMRVLSVNPSNLQALAILIRASQSIHSGRAIIHFHIHKVHKIIPMTIVVAFALHSYIFITIE